MFTYDLETCFIKRGNTRGFTRMLEIGVYQGKRQFQRMVNPCVHYDDGAQLIHSLDSMDQKPESTVRFWTKLLVGKGALKTNVKRMDYEQQAEHISVLLKRSDIAIHKKCPQDWLFALEEFDDIEKAGTFVKTHKCGKPKGMLFFNASEALQDAVEFVGKSTLVAHNGKSFDEKIVRGNAERENIDLTGIEFKDSLPMFKKYLKDQPSYSLPILYKSVLKSSYRAHHALDDSIALYELIEKVSSMHKVSFAGLFEDGLRSIKGVGPKTEDKLVKRNIKTKQQLYKWVENHTIDEWNKQFSDVYQYKKLGLRLFDAAEV
jgi:hypothetical protein